MKAQVSLEYLLILAGFFSALAISLPAINYSVEQFSLANDTLLARDIFEKTNEQMNLFEFLGDGSKKTFEFIPTKSISISLRSGELMISSKQKSFSLKIDSTQNFSNEFSSKFVMSIEKVKGVSGIYFS